MCEPWQHVCCTIDEAKDKVKDNVTHLTVRDRTLTFAYFTNCITAVNSSGTDRAKSMPINVPNLRDVSK